MIDGMLGGCLHRLGNSARGASMEKKGSNGMTGIGMCGLYFCSAGPETFRVTRESPLIKPASELASLLAQSISRTHCNQAGKVAVKYLFLSDKRTPFVV